MARHQRMPSKEAGYTYAVEPVAIDRLLANEEESIYSHSCFNYGRLEREAAIQEPKIVGFEI